MVVEKGLPGWTMCLVYVVWLVVALVDPPAAVCDVIYLQGEAQIDYELIDPERIVAFDESSSACCMSRWSRTAEGLHFTVTAKADPLLSRSPFIPGIAGTTPGTATPVAKLARELTGACRYRRDVVYKVNEWIAGNIEYDATVRLSDPVEVLAVRRASCLGRTQLAAALLTAAGMEVRQVSGYLAGREHAGPSEEGFHRWLEVRYPDVGWLPSSPGFSIDWVDAWHVPLTVSPAGRHSLKYPVHRLGDLGVRLNILAVRNGLRELDRVPAAGPPMYARRLSRDRRTALVEGVVMTVNGEMVTTGDVVIHGAGLNCPLQLNDFGRFALAGLRGGQYMVRWRLPPCPSYQRIVVVQEAGVGETTITIPNVCVEK
ncbi:transglutaminase domain-containing protein [bacterium]|nr:transglutaminase domain-containing protein [candidate division CSSED10-310 bacterium]